MKIIGFNIFFIIFICIKFQSIVAQEADQNLSKQKYESGVLLLKNGSAVLSSYTQTPDAWFLRDEKEGKLIAREQVVDIVSERYFQLISESSKLESAFESLLYFDSSTKYQWKSKLFESEQEDFIVRISKIGLLLFSAFTYYEAVKANEALKESYTGINSDSARNRFNQKKSLFQAVGGITLACFTFTTAHAYNRFGTNSDSIDLNIQNRKKVSLNQYLLRSNSKNQNLEINIKTQTDF